MYKKMICMLLYRLLPLKCYFIIQVFYTLNACHPSYYCFSSREVQHCPAVRQRVFSPCNSLIFIKDQCLFKNLRESTLTSKWADLFPTKVGQSRLSYSQISGTSMISKCHTGYTTFDNSQMASELSL